MKALRQGAPWRVGRLSQDQLAWSRCEGRRTIQENTADEAGVGQIFSNPEAEVK